MPIPVSREDLIAHVDQAVRLRAAKLRQQASPLIQNLLEWHGVEEYQVSNVALNEAVFNCAKDLEKIAIYQKDKADPLKTFGYFGF